MENKTLHIDALQDTLVREQYDAFMKLMAYYRCAMMEIETKLNVLNQEFSLRYDRNPISSIKTRLKSPLSIRGKLERRGLDVSVESIEQNLNDVAGVRVVCSFPEDVRTIAKALLNQDDVILIERKDYILLLSEKYRFSAIALIDEYNKQKAIEFLNKLYNDVVSNITESDEKRKKNNLKKSQQKQIDEFKKKYFSHYSDIKISHREDW